MQLPLRLDDTHDIVDVYWFTSSVCIGIVVVEDRTLNIRKAYIGGQLYSGSEKETDARYIAMYGARVSVNQLDMIRHTIRNEAVS